MHEVIQDVGAALRLDAWRVEARRRNPAWISLEAFAESKPDAALLEQMSNTLATSYVAGYEANLFKMRKKPAADRDPQNENTLSMHKYFLLYEELSYSINYHDIGRLETVFPPWIYILKATGKHKYAAAMTKFLTDVHFLYPEGLKYVHSILMCLYRISHIWHRHAVRYNLIVNPTGKEGRGRGADWVEEANNLFIKVCLCRHYCRQLTLLTCLSFSQSTTKVAEVPTIP